MVPDAGRPCPAPSAAPPAVPWQAACGKGRLLDVRSWPWLLLASAAARGSARAPADELRWPAQAGTTLERSATSTAELSLLDVQVLVDGEPQEVKRGAKGSAKATWTLAARDVVGAEGFVRELRELALSTEGFDGERDQRHAAELEGRRLRFRREGAEAWEVQLEGAEEGAARPEGLAADLDLAALLPGRAV